MEANIRWLQAAEQNNCTDETIVYVLYTTKGWHIHIFLRNKSVVIPAKPIHQGFLPVVSRLSGERGVNVITRNTCLISIVEICEDDMADGA